MREAAAPFDYSGTELEAMQEARNYYRWLLWYFSPHVGRRALEIGAGIGSFAEFLLAANPVEELTLVEPAENLFPLLERRFRGRKGVRMLNAHFEDVAAGLSADSVILINVLEHVENDDALLRAIHRSLAPGGRLLLFVPALPRLYGSLDRAFDHFRRYTKPLLRRKLLAAGFAPAVLRYFNGPGVVSWWVAGRLLRRRSLRPADVRLYDRLVVPWCSRLERLFEPPLGQSLLAVARKGERDSAYQTSAGETE